MGSRKPNKKAHAWRLFDAIVAQAAPDGVHTNPWTLTGGQLVYCPDFDVLERLLGVPLLLKAPTTSGVPALALDVWLSYELRRAGFDPDSTWPRAEHPRVMPRQIWAFLRSLKAKERRELTDRVKTKANIKEVSSASADILGKNYLKQVDVILTDWQTGPELLVSTKRMDSSYGKNAANRVEEAYGDAKNLRLRHPLAAHGFLMALRSDVLDDGTISEWLMDLMAKLGAEEDAYHATSVVLMEYDKDIAPPADDGEATVETVGGTRDADEDSDEASDDDSAEDGDGLDPDTLASELEGLPKVRVLHDEVPDELQAEHFLGILVNHVLNVTPVTLHREARERRKAAFDRPRPGDLGAGATSED